MEFFKRNKDITIGLILTIIISIALLVKIASTSSEIVEQREIIEDNNDRTEKLLSKKYRISKESERQANQNLVEISSKLSDLDSRIQAYQIKTNVANISIIFSMLLIGKLLEKSC